jgi:hypothetical protein
MADDNTILFLYRNTLTHITLPVPTVSNQQIARFSYMSPNTGVWGFAGSQPMITAVHRSSNKLWRSNSIFNIYLELLFQPFLDFELKHLSSSVLQVLELRSFFNLYNVRSLVSTFKILR